MPQELEALCEMRYLLHKEMTAQYGPILEDGGALAPCLKNTEEAFEWMLRIAKQAGYAKHVKLGLDVAASELYRADSGKYDVGSGSLTRAELLDYYKTLAARYPLTFLEDGFEPG